MRFRVVILFLLFGDSISGDATDETCVVRFLDTGSIGIGIPSETFNRVPYCQYLGVRYAEPPVGSLRFKNSVISNPRGVENYTVLGNICPQDDDFRNPQEIIGDEDCLFMNIFSPRRENNGTNLARRKFPVLVFIHGGSFMVGSAVVDMKNGADLLVDSGIMVVSINYRLTRLGFLRYPEFNVSGNFGLKDQRTALQWVQNNIEYFGGDPQRVTLMGQSAGAGSICYHMYSEQSRGLFQQLFPLGGSFLGSWALNFNQHESAERLITALNVTSLEELQSIDFKQLFVRDNYEIFGFFTMFYPSFIPTVEDVSDEEPFITQTPFDIIKTELANPIPVLIGHSETEFELLLGYAKFLYMGENFPNKNRSVIENVPWLIDYYNASSGDENFYRKMANMANLYYPIKRLIKTWSRQDSPIYYFKFGFDGKFGYYKNEFYKSRTNGSRYGAVHGDDLGYIFTPYNVKEALANRSQFNREWKVHEQMVELVANFVKYGNPTPKPLKKLNLTWIPYNDKASGGRYLSIDKTLELRMDDDSDNELFKLWDDIFPCIYYFECENLQKRLDNTDSSDEKSQEDVDEENEI
ncbi:esterase E4-like [Uranotaenia lowii]|uniref:esterase E4-like n=1 Tax=Uranotaenia lowii TaxID=190385 RepID=UPI00247AEE5B|nr:esterase E4-like [Uranotaenia lowii]